MKTKIIFIAIFLSLLVFNAILLLRLERMSLMNMQWESSARNESEFAAKQWAENDFHKGKKVKLRLKIETMPKGYENHGSRPDEFEGDFLIRDWTGYTVLGKQNSPSIQTARIIVETYNKRMMQLYADPEKHRKQLAEEIRYWNENHQRKKGDSN